MRYLAIILFFLMGIKGASAQAKLGMRVGISTSGIMYQDINIFNKDGIKEFSMNVQDANYGIHGGLVLKIKKNHFVFQPEVLFNSNKVDYSIAGNPPVVLDSILHEKYQYLDIPVFLGWQKGILRINGGPVGHVYIANTSEIKEKISGYQQNFQPLTLGWQGGIGLDLWKFMIDIRYEGNFTKFGNHFEFFGEKYKFDKSPSRFLVSVGYFFGKNR